MVLELLVSFYHMMQWTGVGRNKINLLIKTFGLEFKALI